MKRSGSLLAPASIHRGVSGYRPILGGKDPSQGHAGQVLQCISVQSNEHMPRKLSLLSMRACCHFLHLAIATKPLGHLVAYETNLTHCTCDQPAELVANWNEISPMLPHTQAVSSQGTPTQTLFSHEAQNPSKMKCNASTRCIEILVLDQSSEVLEVSETQHGEHQSIPEFQTLSR